MVVRTKINAYICKRTRAHMIQKIRKTIVTLTLLTALGQLQAQTNPTEDSTPAPELEYVCELRVTCDPAYTVGNTSKGQRVIIPITGGTFEGPKMRGTVLPGGADYQLVDRDKGRTELEAIYSIRTDDNVNIHIRNCGLLCNSEGEFYFRTATKFEAPEDSKYDWLNRAIFVCRPGFGQGYISLKVWKVK